MSKSPYSSAVVLLSGGVDSTTLLYSLVNGGVDCLALSFDYGQTHSTELNYAAYVARVLDVEHRMVRLGHLLDGSALTGDRVMPAGHYTEASMAATVVPNRNMVFISLAASMAIQTSSQCVAIAAHADDHGTYPDCRRPFIDAMNAALAVCDYKPVGLWAPFLGMRKREIVALGRTLGIDYKRTWSCYAGGEQPCGKCGACSARNEAMEAA